MKIIIASTNPVKVNAAREAFRLMFPGVVFEFQGISVPSGVADQPMTDAETFTGALNRAANASAAVPDADYWVGIEGGLEKKRNELEVFAWTVIKDKSGAIGKGRTATFFLPPVVAREVLGGMELGAAADLVFKESNCKQNMGTIGILTGGLIDRTKYYVDPLIIALIPFKNAELYKR